ncbi:MAG TPA: hypothetical protein PLJ20_11670, partial [Candidatus Contendobacter sp.]|nr:hypothetical protein [Candidatus Contendobacter sp.]
MTTLRRRPCALFGILLLWCSGLTLAAEAATTPLLLHDFERATGTPNLGGTMSGWTAEPGHRTGRVEYRLEPASGPDRSRALHLRYRFAPGATGDLGWQITLPDLDASAYDH